MKMLEMFNDLIGVAEHAAAFVIVHTDKIGLLTAIAVIVTMFALNIRQDLKAAKK